MNNKPRYAIITGLLVLLPIAVYFYINSGESAASKDTHQEQQQSLTSGGITNSVDEAVTPAIPDTILSDAQTDQQMPVQEADVLEEIKQEPLAATAPSQADLTTSTPEDLSNLLSQLDVESQAHEIIKLISQYDSAEAAEIFLSYLIDNQELPDELQKALIDSLNNTTDRERVAALIADGFIDLSDPAMRDKLLMINQPESLEKISLFALEQGDLETYEKAVERLKSNPSEHTFEALMTMYQSDYSNHTDLEGFLSPEVIASDWAYQQLSGSRLNFIEQKLEAGEYSEEEKDFILLILGASEDQDRGNELIKKFWGVNEGA